MFKDKRFFALLIMLVLVASLALSLLIWNRSRYNEEEFKSVLSSAEQAYERKEYSSALKLFAEAAEIGAINEDGHVGIVKVLSEKGYYTEADEAIVDAKATLSSPQVAGLYQLLAKNQQVRGDYSEAYKSAQNAYDSNRNEETSLLAAELAVLSNQLANVEKYMKSVSESDSTFYSEWRSYSELMATSAEEIDLYKTVKSARSMILSGYPAFSASLLSRFEAELTNYWEGFYYLGRSEFELGEFEKAQLHLENAISLGADDYALSLYLARTYVEVGQLDFAYEYYERSLAFAPAEEQTIILGEYVDLLITNKQYNLATVWINAKYQLPVAPLYAMRLAKATEQWDKFVERSEEFNSEAVGDGGKEYKVEYAKLMLDYRLAISSDPVDHAVVDSLMERLALSGDSSSELYYQGLRARKVGDVELARNLFVQAIDQDLAGDVSKRAEMYLE